MADTDILGVIGSYYRTVLGTFIAVAAGNYADNDVISNDATEGAGDPTTFSDVVTIGRAAKIVGAKLTYSEDGILATSELFLFNALPTASEMDDNAAWGGIGAADEAKFLGSIAFSAAVDQGDFSMSLPTTLTADVPFFVHAGATSNLYGILVLRDAETNETAGMTVNIRLYIE